MSITARYDAAVAAGRLREDAAQRALLPRLDRLKDALEAPPPRRRLFGRGTAPEAPKGLYLWGGVGRGKSMLMDLACQGIDAPLRRAHFHAFMQWVHARIAAARARGVEDAIAPVAEEIAAEVRLLAFDEMQITDITDAMLVGRLFEGLFARGVTVIATSNRAPDDLYRNGLNRQLFLPFIALLKERMEVVELASPTDHRQDRLAGSPSYFTPADARARAAVEAIWQDLTGGTSERLVLKVTGREVVLDRFANGVAREGFFALCGRPLGAADYLALADAVRVLILEDIPRLSRNNFNEAKRFVTLIDALYEARVRLIATAAAAPEYLYVEGEGSFEFERTASRLREMQSADWTGQAAPSDE